MWKKKENFIPFSNYCYDIVNSRFKKSVKFCSYLGKENQSLICKKRNKVLSPYFFKLCEETENGKN